MVDPGDRHDGVAIVENQDRVPGLHDARVEEDLAPAALKDGGPLDVLRDRVERKDGVRPLVHFRVVEERECAAERHPVVREVLAELLYHVSEALLAVVDRSRSKGEIFLV